MPNLRTSSSTSFKRMPDAKVENKTLGQNNLVEKIPMSDWSNLTTKLLWIYDGPVDPVYQNSSVHARGQSALLVRQGSVVIQNSKGVVPGKAGEWIFPTQGERSQKLSSDAYVLSIHFLLNWPGGQPLFDFPVAFTLKEHAAPHLQIRAKRLARWVEREFPNIKSHLPRALGTLETHVRYQHYFTAWLHAFVQTLQEHDQTPCRLGSIDSRVLRAVQLLDHYSLHSKLIDEKIADQVNLSNSQLDRLFVKQFGMTPRNYFDKRKLEHAMTRMQSSPDSVKQIASDLGFSSLTYFSAWFHDRTGLSPSAFKKGPSR